MRSRLTEEEIKASVCETGEITPSEVLDFDVVVVGAGAAGVPAAGWAAELGAKTALLQKEINVVSQGNCGSAIIKSRSTEAGIAKWIHHTNGLCDWRADVKQLRAYAEHSEEAMMWFLNRAGLTNETEYQGYRTSVHHQFRAEPRRRKHRNLSSPCHQRTTVLQDQNRQRQS